MSYRLRVTALKMLMVGRARDQFEIWEEEYRDDADDNSKKLLSKVQDYATRRRLEANYTKNKVDPMDITEVGNAWGNYDEWNEEWTDQWQAGDIDTFGKSKGKGAKGKGKGKGKS